MRRFVLLALLALGSLGCASLSQDSPMGVAGDVSKGLPLGAVSEHEFLVAGYELTIDPVTSEAIVTTVPLRGSMAQPPQAISYDFDINSFRTRNSFRLTGLSTDSDGDLQVNFSHAHPFGAPNLTQPPSGSNRADLGYTGRLLILAEEQSQSYFAGTVTLDPSLVKEAAGFVRPGTLLAASGLTNTAFPYVLLADEVEDNRVGLSNNAVMTGNYAEPAGGWQYANAGATPLDWTGYDFVHQGQTVVNSFTLRRSVLGAGPFSLQVALLIKYTDPRGTGGNANRLPTPAVDVTRFAYRCPFAALDCSVIEPTSSNLTISYLPSSLLNFEVALRDWDRQATPAGDADLSDELSVTLVQPAGPGVAVGVIDVPALSATPFPLTANPGSGLPGSEATYDVAVLNNFGTALGGLYYGCIRMTDPEDSDGAAANYRFGVDPLTISASQSRAMDVVTYQAIEYRVLAPPVVSSVSPLSPAGLTAAPVTFAGVASNLPTSWSWNFGGGAIPNTSLATTPLVTLGDPGTYFGSVTASNAVGTSVSFPFSFTVQSPSPPVWQTHIIDNPAPGAPLVGRASSLTIFNNRPVVAYLDDSTTDLKIARALVAQPVAPSDWQVHTVESSNQVGVAPTVLGFGGLLYIAHGEETFGYLRIARSTTATPTSASDWVTYQASNTQGVVRGTALVENGGSLWAAWNDFQAPRGLRLLRSITTTPSSLADWTESDIVTTMSVSAPVLSMALLGDKLVLSVQEETFRDLWVLRATTSLPSGTGSWTNHSVDTAGLVGQNSDIVVLNGRMAVSYWDESTSNFKIALAQVPLPAVNTDWLRYAINPTNDQIGQPSLAVQGGRLAVSWNHAGGGLRLARAAKAMPLGTADWVFSTVPASGSGSNSSLAANGTGLGATYWDAPNQDLRWVGTSSPW